jgi:hypothetical protein
VGHYQGGNVIKRVLTVVAAVLAALVPVTVFAIDDPTSISIEDVRAYDGVLTTDDLLLVIEYNLVYGSAPTETINQAYLGRFKREGTEYASVEPFAYNDKGYGRGVFSLYWTKEQKESDSIEFNNPNSETYTVTLQGKVGVFPGTAPSTTTGTIHWQDSTNTTQELFTHIQALANKFQNDAGWSSNIPLISTSASVTKLEAKGEDYFANAVPLLGSMIPSIFTYGRQTPDDTMDVHSRNFESEVKQFWNTDGNWVDARFENLAETFRMPKAVITSFLSLFIIAGVVWGCAKLLEGTSQGWEFGLMTMAVTLPLLTAVNWMPMGVTMSVALFALLGIGWTLFLRRAGS